MPPTAGRITSPTRRSWPGSTPASSRQAAERARAQGLEGWVFGLEQPTYVAVITDAESAALRRVFYEAWCTRASDQGPGAGRYDNTAVIEEILRLRHEAAQLLGFPSYAEYALADRMARSVPEVLDFLRELARAARASAGAELAELEGFAGRPLDPWDITFYSERLQQRRFQVSQEELRDYLPLPRVLDCLFEVAERLYGVRLQERSDVRGVASGRALLRAARAGWHAARQLLPRCLRARQQARRRVDGRLRRPQAARRRAHPAGRLPGVQFTAAAGRAAGAADARRRGHAVPRIRARPAPHADAHRLSEHRRHQRRGLGRGRAAQPVHGELRLAAGGAGAHGRARHQRRADSRGQAPRAHRHAQLPCRAADAAPGRVRAVRHAHPCRVRPGARRRASTRCWPRCAPRWR